MEFIKADIETRVNARNIIKSVLKNELNEPILRKDLIPKITDNTVKSTLQTVKDVVEVRNMPKIGEQLLIDVLYLYSSEDENYTIKCRQTHNRTIYDPKDVPALFSFFRENADDLEWIPNEQVELGWKRVHEGVIYERIQAHMTLEAWEPNNTPSLWKAESGGEVSEWVQPTGAHDAFRINSLMRYTDGKVYKSLIDYNTYSPQTYPAGWQLIE
jgi:hypothetical protein